MKKLWPYVQIARPDHWFKNIFLLPGMCLGLLFVKSVPSNGLVIDCMVGLLATCIIASANYTINEYLDAEFDRKHPTKHVRPAAMGLIDGRCVAVEYIFLSALGLTLAFIINYTFFMFSLLLLLCGIFYNVKPMRTKDIPYLDVVSESINNPIRLMLGWSVILPDKIPPLSFILAYWFGGAFLMSLKRYAEYKRINSHGIAVLYRKSFLRYNQNVLLMLAFFCALNTALFLGISLIKYRIEFIVLFPFIAGLFVWYFHIGLKENSIVQNPEKLYKEKRFILFILFLVVLFSALCFIDIPILYKFNGVVLINL